MILFIFHIKQLLAGGTNKQTIVFFRSSRIRTLVAMVTNSSYRLIMGKEEIVFFSVSFRIIFGIFSYRNVN